MFCEQVKEYLSHNQISFDDRDITKDPSAISELRKLGYLTTPVTVIGEHIIIGFDESRLSEALRQAGA
jgi:glutaredoxin